MSLLSIGELCDAGCTAEFTANELRVLHLNKVVLTGRRTPSTNQLWQVNAPPPPPPVASKQELTTTTPTVSTSTTAPSKPLALLAVNPSTTPADLVAFAHAALFSPATTTLQKAVDLNYVTGFPGLSSRSLKKHTPVSEATAKGHLDQARKGRQSTKKTKPEATDSESDTFPAPLPNGHKTHFCFAAVLDNDGGQVFSDQTGRFPTTSSTGHKYVFVLYDYDSNHIDAEPMKNRTATAILDAYKLCHARLVTAGLRPRLQKLDNECSTILKEFMQQEEIDFQLVPPGIHRRNAAERAIRTFKNHFIAGLCSTNKEFPMHLWDRLLPQAVLTLNLLRGSRLNPKLSAHTQVHGVFDYNRTPIAPPGIKVQVHEKPDDRKSWSPHSVDGWYIGPAPEHYRCYRVWVVSTRAERIADTLQWFPDRFRMPAASSTDIIRAGVNDIVQALQHPSPASPLNPVTPTESDALQQLTAILDNVLPDAVPAKPSPSPPPAKAVSFAPTPPASILRVPTTSKQTTKRRDPAADLRVLMNDNPQPGRAQRRNRTRRLRSRNPRRVATSHTAFSAISRALDDAAFPVPHVHTANGVEIPNDHLPAASRKWLHFAFAAMNPDTSLPAEYPELLRSSAGQIWEDSCSDEIGRLAQGNSRVKGTDTIFFIKHTDIPAGRRATYLRNVVTDRPQKANPARVRWTAGGDQVDYPGEVSTKTADLTTAKILLNSVVSTPGAKFMGIDLKDFYLNTPLKDRYEYMRIPVTTIPADIFDLYNLSGLVYNGYVYVEIRRGMYGLPQAGRIANDELLPHLAKHGYHQSKHIAGLFTHETRPIKFCLVVDDFGVQYVGKEHANHLVQVLESKYVCTLDWEGKTFCGITLEWDYVNRTVDLSMPGYVEKALQRFQHTKPKRAQHSPSPYTEPVYGANSSTR